MATDFSLIDPPDLLGIEHRKIEDFQGVTVSRSFVHFRWHGSDIWLLGQMRWHNIMSIGYVGLRLPRGNKTYRAGISAHPREEPPGFSVSLPRGSQGPLKGKEFVFLGFKPEKVVNMDFVREEDHRLSALPYAGQWEREKKNLVRPPSGKIV